MCPPKRVVRCPCPPLVVEMKNRSIYLMCHCFLTQNLIEWHTKAHNHKNNSNVGFATWSMEFTEQHSIDCTMDALANFPVQSNWSRHTKLCKNVQQKRIKFNKNNKNQLVGWFSHFHIDIDIDLNCDVLPVWCAALHFFLLLAFSIRFVYFRFWFIRQSFTFGMRTIQELLLLVFGAWQTPTIQIHTQNLRISWWCVLFAGSTLFIFKWITFFWMRSSESIHMVALQFYLLHSDV